VAEKKYTFFVGNLLCKNENHIVTKWPQFESTFAIS
jgi:hypothetical protein